MDWRNEVTPLGSCCHGLAASELAWGPRAGGWGPSRAGWQRAWLRALRGELHKKAWGAGCRLRLLHSLVVLLSAGNPGVTEDLGPGGRAPAVILTVPGIHQNEVIKRPVLLGACSYGTWIDSTLLNLDRKVLIKRTSSRQPKLIIVASESQLLNRPRRFQ